MSFLSVKEPSARLRRPAVSRARHQIGGSKFNNKNIYYIRSAWLAIMGAGGARMSGVLVGRRASNSKECNGQPSEPTEREEPHRAEDIRHRVCPHRDSFFRSITESFSHPETLFRQHVARRLRFVIDAYRGNRVIVVHDVEEPRFRVRNSASITFRPLASNRSERLNSPRTESHSRRRRRHLHAPRQPSRVAGNGEMKSQTLKLSSGPRPSV